MLDIALELERIALQDDYFVSRKLYPNVDFYSGLIYQAMKFPVTMFPVMSAIARTSGWIAQWQEMVLDSEQKISRPRQLLGIGQERLRTHHEKNVTRARGAKRCDGPDRCRRNGIGVPPLSMLDRRE